MTKGENPFVQYLVDKFIKDDKKFLLKYTKAEDEHGITNIKKAQRKVVEETIKYIKNNKL